MPLGENVCRLFNHTPRLKSPAPFTTLDWHVNKLRADNREPLDLDALSGFLRPGLFKDRCRPRDKSRFDEVQTPWCQISLSVMQLLIREKKGLKFVS
jgi:hypothetical protein